MVFVFVEKASYITDALSEIAERNVLIVRIFQKRDDPVEITNG
jgi:hypothetical protein